LSLGEASQQAAPLMLVQQNRLVRRLSSLSLLLLAANQPV